MRAGHVRGFTIISLYGGFCLFRLLVLLVLLVNESEYNSFTGTKPIQWRCCIYYVLPWRAAAAGAAADFAAAAARPHPTPPPSWGRESAKKAKKKKIIRAPSGQQDEETLFVTSNPHLLRIKRPIDR